jgi:hypothetical protein
VADLESLRAGKTDGTLYKLTGEVVLTWKQSFQNWKFIQDGTAAIMIYDDDGKITTDYSIGDGIKGITGTLYDYEGMLELIPVTDPGAASSSGNTVTPQTLTISEFKANFENYEAEVVRLDTVHFVDVLGKFSNGENYDVFRGSDSTLVRIHFYDAGLSGVGIPAIANVTGIGIWRNGEATVSPRSTSEVETVTLPDNVGRLSAALNISVYPNPCNGEFKLEWKGERARDLDIEILNMNGKLVYRNAFWNVASVHELIDLAGEPSGMYLLRVRSDDRISIHKLMIR